MDPLGNFAPPNHKYTLIFLHGVGWSAEGFSSYLVEKGMDSDFLDPFKHCRIILPEAKKKNVKLYAGK